MAEEGPARQRLEELAELLDLALPPGEGEAAIGLVVDGIRRLVASERRSRQAAATDRAASLALSRSPDSRALLEELLDYLSWIVAYDAAQVFLAGPEGALRPRAFREWRSGPRPPLLPHAEAMTRRSGNRSLVEEAEGLRLLCIPLPGPGRLLGAAIIAREDAPGAPSRPFDEEELRAAEAFAGQAAAALQNASLFEELKRADEELLRSYDTSIEILSKTLDLRDHETEGHSLRVAARAATLARDIGLEGESLVKLRRGALLHDVGKIGVPDAVLLKPGPLDPDEVGIMRLHPVYARELLEGIPFLRAVLVVPWCHHERWDGTGYPRGLAGRDIPIEARIFAVADVWDALTHDRPYRRAISEDEALRMIAAGAGSHFDPVVVEAFMSSARLGI
jgi:GAF domain-containing protein